MKLKEFEAKLEVARQERLEKRRLERKAKRKAEAVALKKAEEEKECESNWDKTRRLSLTFGVVVQCVPGRRQRRQSVTRRGVCDRRQPMPR